MRHASRGQSLGQFSGRVILHPGCVYLGFQADLVSSFGVFPPSLEMADANLPVLPVVWSGREARFPPARTMLAMGYGQAPCEFSG
jgi:hypothetical protein